MRTKYKKNNLLKFIRFLFIKNKYKFLIVLLLIIILSLVNFYMVYFLKRIISFFGDNTILIKLIFIYLLFQFSTSIFKKIFQYYKFKLKDEAIININNEFLSNCASMSFDEFEYSETYDTIQRVDSFINMNLSDFIENLFLFVEALINIFISMLLIISIDIRLIILIVLLPLISVRFYRKINKMEYELILKNTGKHRKSNYYSMLLTKDYFFKDLKTQNAGGFIKKKIFDLRTDIYVSKKNYYLVRIQYELIFFGIYMVVLVLILFVSLNQNDILLNVSFFVFYLNIMNILNGNITQISKSLIAIAKNKYLIDEYYSINLNKNVKLVRKKIIQIDSIIFKNVSFKYSKSENYAIENISFQLKKGKPSLLQGINGSGKSTIIKLLSGLYDNYEGEILINDTELRKIDLFSYQDRLSVLFQDFNKYELTVLENLNLKADSLKLFETPYNQYLQNLTGIDKLIGSMDKKYFQQLGNWFSGGIQLSGGQWQKIALSRALMKMADLYLLDEPTSMLDNISSEKFMKNINKVFCEKFCLIVTHEEIMNNENINKIIM